MTALPAYCPRCKSIFPFRGIALAEGVTIGLESIATDCPVCGFGDARVSDGIYKATKDAIQVLAGPDSTRVMAEALKVLAERLAEGQITKEEALQKAADLSQKYAALLDACSRIGLPGLALLVAIIALYLQYEANKSSAYDAQKLLDAVTQQTFVMKELVNKHGVDRKRDTPSDNKSKQKTSAVESPSNRRAEVNKERRMKLRKQRTEFGGARSH